MSVRSVRAALESRLLTMPGGLPSAMQNAAFAPVAGVPYQQINTIFAPPDNQQAGASYFERGIFQVLLMYPAGAGPGAAEAQAELIRTHFQRNTVATHGGVRVVVMTTPEIAQGLVLDGRFAVPVSVTFQALVNP
jgi:hypothetical protein